MLNTVVHMDSLMNTHVGMHTDAHVDVLYVHLDVHSDVHSGRPGCMPCGQVLPAATVHRACRRLHPLSAAVPRASIVDIRMDFQMDVTMPSIGMSIWMQRHGMPLHAMPWHAIACRKEEEEEEEKQQKEEET